MLYFVLIILLVALIIFISRKYRKYDKEFAEKREKFVEYLDEKNDIETLKKIGEINMFGQRERVYPRYSQIVDYIEKKYQETKDEKFKEFLKDYKIQVINFSIMIPIIIISILIIIHLIERFFS